MITWERNFQIELNVVFLCAFRNVYKMSDQLNRDELEDKFFKLKEEHQELKREAHNAGYQMKFLNAKLSRLIEEKKKLLKKEKSRREVDLEEMVYDLQEKIALVER